MLTEFTNLNNFVPNQFRSPALSFSSFIPRVSCKQNVHPIVLKVCFSFSLSLSVFKKILFCFLPTVPSSTTSPILINTPREFNVRPPIVPTTKIESYQSRYHPSIVSIYLSFPIPTIHSLFPFCFPYPFTVINIETFPTTNNTRP